MMSFLTYITVFFMNFELLPILTDLQIDKGGMKLKKNLLWYYWANLNQSLLKWSLGGPLSKSVSQCRPVSKTAAITKNRIFFKWPKLLYFKPESAQIWTV